ncbi:MAG TPA: tetratricopeptide repeat protein [Kofleriaceae bacterium]
MRWVIPLVALASVAYAQPAPRVEDKAEADRLFEEGRVLIEQGKRAEACAKFTLSIKKDPRAVGTMLNLGLCHEEIGHVATAIRYYAEARDRAHDQKLEEHKEAAERKIALLSPRVPHLAVKLPANANAARVLVDDIVLAMDQLAAVPVDPGQHTLVVTAPGKLPFETTFEVAEAERRAIDVPALEGAKTVFVSVATNRRRTWGKLAVVSGAGLLVIAGGVGWWAQHSYWAQFPDASRDGQVAKDDDHPCWTRNEGTRIVRECNSIGSDKLKTARTLAHVSTGSAIVGGVALVGGAILWLTAPRDEQTTRVTLDVGRDHAGVAWTRAF